MLSAADPPAAAHRAAADPHGSYRVLRHGGEVVVDAQDCVAEETPVALVYNGISHAVMMATPQDLEDFAVGFSLSEGIVALADELYDVEVAGHDEGFSVQIELASERMLALRLHRRALSGRTGCGVCGVESLAHFRRPVACVSGPGGISPQALTVAHEALAARQPLFGLTGAVHAAAWCKRSGEIELVREDVGRHNALDKLIGALAGARRSCADGFVLMTSRASYEIVHKAASAGIAIVAAMSAPTGLAVRVAEAAGVTLVGFARSRCHSVYAHPQRIHISY